MQGEGEFPERLYLGDLVPGSFTAHKNGAWSVRYEALPFHVEVSRRNSMVWIEAFLGGRTAGIAVTRVQLLPSASLPFFAPLLEGLHRVVKEQVEERFRVRYAVVKGVESGFYPDAEFVSIWMPVPFTRRAFNLVAEVVATLVRESTPIGGSLEPVGVAMNFVVGRCPDVPDDPDGLMLWAMELGLLPQHKPVFEKGDNSEALTLRASAYRWTITVPLRDLFRLLELLEAGEALPDRDSSHWTPAVGPVTYPALARELPIWSKDRSRRTVLFFDGATDDEDCEPFASPEAFAARLQACAGEYERWAVDLLDGNR